MKPNKLLYKYAGDRKHEFRTAVADAFGHILYALERTCGISRYSANFKDTPERVARAYEEIFGGLFTDETAIKEILTKTFPSKSTDMVIVGPVNVWSVCPHHFLPVQLQVWVGYLPKKNVLGLSKLARLAELVAKRPALQEDTTAEIAGLLQKNLTPKGTGCYIRGRHLCMEMRGVKKTATTTTTSLQGSFLKAEVRAEFLAAIRGEK